MAWQWICSSQLTWCPHVCLTSSTRPLGVGAQVKLSLMFKYDSLLSPVTLIHLTPSLPYPEVVYAYWNHLHLNGSIHKPKGNLYPTMSVGQFGRELNVYIGGESELQLNLQLLHVYVDVHILNRDNLSRLRIWGLHDLL